MIKLTAFFKQLRLRQLLTACLATVVLFVGTACSNGDTRGARPDNPPVQAGGMNNPYKAGEDANTNYNFSADPKVSSKSPHSNPDRADLLINSNQLVAVSEKLQYPGESEIKGSPADEQNVLPTIDQKDFETPEPNGKVQRESNVGNRVKDRLSAVKDTFGEASEFIGEGFKEAAQGEINSPKTTKANFR